MGTKIGNIVPLWFDVDFSLPTNISINVMVEDSHKWQFWNSMSYSVHSYILKRFTRWKTALSPILSEKLLHCINKPITSMNVIIIAFWLTQFKIIRASHPLWTFLFIFMLMKSFPVVSRRHFVAAWVNLLNNLDNNGARNKCFMPAPVSSPQLSWFPSLRRLFFVSSCDLVWSHLKACTC